MVKAFASKQMPKTDPLGRQSELKEVVRRPWSDRTVTLPEERSQELPEGIRKIESFRALSKRKREASGTPALLGL